MPPNHDPLTGEIMPERAADGRALAPTATTLSQFIAVLGEGEFDRAMAEVLTNMVDALRDAAIASDGTAKGSITIKLAIKREANAFFIDPTYTVTTPKDKFGRAMMFATEDGRFTPNPPHQGQLFGVRDVTPDRNYR